MTPFKGQGANQTLVDACLMAKCVAAALLADAAEPPDAREDARDAHDDASARYDASADRRLSALGTALGRFEREMGNRAEPKVITSREITTECD
jgi:hypothetical protein